jgi:hypothetical protein
MKREIKALILANFIFHSSFLLLWLFSVSVPMFHFIPTLKVIEPTNTIAIL